jgi:hypothetical protein
MQPTLSDVDEEFAKLLVHSASPKNKPRLALRLPDEEEDCIRYARKDMESLPTPTAAEVDKELERVMQKGLFGVRVASLEALDIPKDDIGDADLWLEILPTPTAREVDADFGNLLQSPKPQLVLHIPSEVGFYL